MRAEERIQLQNNIIAGLPGSEESYSLDDLRTAIDKYKNIDTKILQQHLIDFLKEVIPVAEEAGIKMAIHPDDPPYSLLGLPKVTCNARQLEQLFEEVPSLNNGLCFVQALLELGLIITCRKWWSNSAIAYTLCTCEVQGEICGVTFMKITTLREMLTCTMW